MSTPQKIHRLDKHDRLKRILLKYGDAHDISFYFRQRTPAEKFSNKNEVKQFTYLLGGDIAVAKCIGVRREAVWGWGDRNRIPKKHWKKLAEMANEKGVVFPRETLIALQVNKLTASLNQDT